jgi:hypothetical protein
MSAPRTPDSLLCSKIREYAEEIDRNLGQEQGQTLREQLPYPLTEITGAELMDLYYRLMELSRDLRKLS